MHLQNQARADPLMIEPRLQRNHRELDEIGGRTLHRRVDRSALGRLPSRAAARVDVRQP